ncbi:MAG: NAD-dependent epimerase/dehydratase family protein [Candidatus Methanomethylicia archaeon]|nr:NAD-dependent epimerase/dehydratase family protein [Candidatus Methanomethylicia archaeon]
MKILITGGAGFIGSHLVDRLVKDGFDVYVIDNLFSGCLDNISLHIDSGLKFFNFDISSIDILHKLSNIVVDVIVHLAALISVEESNIMPIKYHQVNVMGTLNILEFARRIGVKKFIFISSAAVYGDPLFLPINELHPLNPKSIYAASKIESEILVDVYSKLYGFKAVSLRLFNVYGPRQRLNSYSGVIRIFLNNALKGLPLTIYGDGEQTRDFIYVDDVIDAIMLFIDNNDFIFNVYNVGTGKPTRIIDLAKIVMELIGGVELKFEKSRIGDIRFSYADISRIVNEFNFRCKIDLREGLKRTLNYLKSYG